MKKFFLFYIFLFVIGINAQDIFFCRSISEMGEPIDADIKWKIEPYGTTISILYKSESIIENDLLYLFIDKKMDEEYKPFDSKTTRPEGGKNWIGFEYEFNEEGEYKVYVMNSGQKKLAANNFKTAYTSKFNPEKKNEEQSYTYFDNAKVIFCERVFTNKPYNLLQSASTTSNNGIVYVYVDNQKPLNTDVILAYIYKKKNRAFEYDNFVDSKKFRVNENWNNTYFKYRFESAGDYKISLYNKDEKLIKNAFIKVR